VALLVVVVAILFLLLNWYVAPAEPGASVRKALVVAVAQILGGTALLSGLYFTWRTLQVNREGQITDRFTRAIEHLGKVEDGKKLFEIRIGGIYALERIARESEVDYWPIMETLTAYVRQNAPRLREESQEDTGVATEKRSDIGGSGGKSEITEPPAPDPDIQAVMTVLRRRTRSYQHGEPEPLDLHGTNLSGANLSGAVLYDARLSGADLSGADLSGASLRGANLRGADLSKVNLREVDLRGANLTEANLTEANLTEANLTDEQLRLTQGDETTQIPPHLKPPAHWV
jgi:Pentapeptide repeats (8 copies)